MKVVTKTRMTIIIAGCADILLIAITLFMEATGLRQKLGMLSSCFDIAVPILIFIIIICALLWVWEYVHADYTATLFSILLYPVYFIGAPFVFLLAGWIILPIVLLINRVCIQKKIMQDVCEELTLMQNLVSSDASKICDCSSSKR